MHAAAPRRVTCYSSLEIRIVWSSGVCKLPVVSEVFGNAVSGDAALSSSSSCCAPISLLRCSPKPQYGCRTYLYMFMHILAACVVRTSDTCPVVLDIRPPLPSTSVLYWALPDVRFALHHGLLQLTYGLSFVAPHPPSHNIPLHIRTRPPQQSSPRTVVRLGPLSD